MDNNPPPNTSGNGDSSMGIGMVIGIVLVIGILFILFLYFGTGGNTEQTNDATAPEEIDVNIEGNIPPGNNDQ